MTTPFVTVNIDGPPTLHQQATVHDLLTAAETLRQFALGVTIKATTPPPPVKEPEGWDDRP